MKYKHCAVVIGFSFLVIIPGLCQQGFSKRIKPDGPAMSFMNLISIDDTLYVTGIRRNVETNQQGVLWAQIDTSGNLLDYKLYIDSLGDHFGVGYSYSIIYTQENNFVLCGTVIGRSSGILIKLNHYGELQWLKEYTFDYPDVRNTHMKKVIELEDGYLVSGSQSREDYFFDMYAMKMNKQGNVVWFQQYGEPGVDEFCTNMQMIHRNLFVLTGDVSNDSQQPIQDRWFYSALIYIDSMGNVVGYWDAEPEIETTASDYFTIGSDFIYSASDWEIYEDEVGDQYLFYSPVIIRRDSNFEKVWKYNVETVATPNNVIFNMERLADGNFLAVGQWALPEFPVPEVEIHGCMLKISPEGEKIWSRCDTVPGYSWGYNRFWLCGVAELSSGSIVAAGGHDNIENPGAKSYGWLVKVDEDGCMLDTLCTTTSLYEQILEREALQVAPNPASEAFQVTVPEDGLFSVISPDGRVIYTEEFFQGKHMIDCQKWPSGVFYLRLNGETGQYLGKIVVQ